LATVIQFRDTEGFPSIPFPEHKQLNTLITVELLLVIDNGTQSTSKHEKSNA
jgi:hypothetical protein